MSPHEFQPIRPRVRSPFSGVPRRLDEALGEAIAKNAGCVIELVGPRRSGKTTALRLIGESLAVESPRLIDDADHAVERLEAIASARSESPVIYTTRNPLCLAELEFRLLPWDDDDVLECILLNDYDRHRSIASRYLGDPERHRLLGQPELIRLVIDQFAQSDAPIDIREALNQGLRDIFADLLPLAQSYAFERSIERESKVTFEKYAAIRKHSSRKALAMHPFASELLAAAYVHRQLHADSTHAVLEHHLPTGLLDEIGRGLSDHEDLIVMLKSIVNRNAGTRSAMAASILHRALPGWRPSRDRCNRLVGASFPGADWNEIDLSFCALAGVNLIGARLRSADLRRASLGHADMSGTDLENANLDRVFAQGADFSNARMRGCCLRNAFLHQARFCHADMTGVDALFSQFSDADFHSAILRDATLTACDFSRCQLRDADLAGAAMQQAKLPALDLRTVDLRNADLTGTKLMECRLDGCDLPGAQMSRADLHSADLTASHISGGHFVDANLTAALLADIDWPGADLRGADLRHANFHMGSSRSGLVGSPYPSHGTRTGFYTDDFDDQTHRCPEEIRKANLSGADLRGANIDSVDFYLVDLRGARYDADQARMLRQCDAILDDRS